METIFLELNYPTEYNQEQLDAYRNIGSVAHLKRLRRQELKRIKRMRRIKLALKGIFLGACVAFGIWVLASWVDVVLHNTNPNPVYQAWNLFVLAF